MTYTGDGTVATEKILAQMVFAGKYRWQDVSLFAQLKNNESSSLLAYGVEYSPSFFSMMQVVGGFKNYEVGSNIRSGYTMGLNMRVKGLQFQYAY